MPGFDPRHYQIAALTLLLGYGLIILQFDVTPARVAAIVGTALLTQAVCSRIAKIAFDPRSALISALSLCLLIRSNSIVFPLLAAIIAIASKFVIRWNGKHIFNPTNGAIVALMLISDRVWVSPGQWGSVAFFSFLIICLGGLVVNRAARSDVTYAFIAFWAAIVIGRSMWLGEPLTIPLHRLENGALLLFTFFMISDPKTTPDSRAGRILFAALVALGAGYIQYRLFRTNGLLWSLAGFSLLVPLIDVILPADRYSWSAPQTGSGGFRMKRIAATAPLLVMLLLIAPKAHAFCGFYVAKGDTKLFNRASQVVLVRDGDKTVMTMANDFKGNPKEFAVVIPVPTVLQKGQIHVGEKALIDHLDAYSSPRLVEYFDPDPCQMIMYERMPSAPLAAQSGMKDNAARAKSLGVTIEAQYTVGEYDILILSAKQSDGLEIWLKENGYTLPAGASQVLGSYIRQNMKFFVAKVNLQEQAKLGFSYLRPLQVAYESPKYMLPIRLGTVNANGPQELFIYTLTRNGRVETTNYRTIKLPSDVDIPVYVRERFGDFYKAMFSEQVRRENMTSVFLEYAWNMSWCDPCAADPLTEDELRKLGVFWLGEEDKRSGSIRQPVPPRGGPVDVFLTRLHVRYDRAHFPEDLVFQETGDSSNFQARYVLRHPFDGRITCDEGRRYRENLRSRQEKEVINLARLTGWKIGDIRREAKLVSLPPKAEEKKSWWEKIWD
ncbi:MAG: DUF2330 domain-containing protein [Thermoanaerobaculia bacterium]